MMKKIWLVAFVVLYLPFFTKAQEVFEIKGKVTGLASPKVYLTYTDDYGKYTLDSALVAKNGSFSFAAEVSHPVKAIVFSRSDKWRSDFILEKGQTRLEGDIHGQVIVVGGANQKAFVAYREEEQKSAVFFSELNQRFAEAQNNQEADTLAVIQQKWNEKLAQNVIVAKDFIRKHTDLYVALEPLYTLLSKNAIDYEEAKEFFDKLDPTLKSIGMGDRIADLLNKKKLTAIGERYTDFEQPDQNGAIVKLSGVLGKKYTLVHFWMSGSPSGRKENVAMTPIYEKYKPKGLEIVAVSFDEDRNEWLKAIDTDKAVWIQLSDLRGWNKNGVADLYDISTLPQNFLIDDQGIIVAKNLFGSELFNHLNKILK